MNATTSTLTRPALFAFGCALTLLGGLLLPVPRPVQAQDAHVAAGEEVRVTTHQPIAQRDHAVRYTGLLIAYDADSLRLAVRGRPFTIPRHAVQRLEVRRGEKSAAGRGALIGAAAGGLVLGVVAYAADAGDEGPDCPSTSWCIDVDPVSPGGAFLVGFGAGAAGGALAGALIGAGFKVRRWVEVPVGRGLVVTPTLGRHGGGLTLRLAVPGR